MGASDRRLSAWMSHPGGLAMFSLSERTPAACAAGTILAASVHDLSYGVSASNDRPELCPQGGQINRGRAIGQLARRESLPGKWLLAMRVTTALK